MVKMSDLAASVGKSNTKPKKTQKTQVATQNSLLSSTKVSGSDIDSETEDSESASSSDEESEPAVKQMKSIKPAKSTLPVSKVKGLKKGESRSSSASGSDDQSESESESGDDSDDDDLPENPVDAPRNRKSTTPIPPPARVEPSKSRKFEPPTGFETLTGTKNTKPRASSLFKPNSIEGKQIWYITAPASIPISTIKTISAKDVKSGKPSVTVKGENYAFIQGTEESSMLQVLLPEESGTQYRQCKQHVNQTLHLQHMVKLARKPLESTSVRLTKKAPRPQPEGLKMRFQPIGFKADDTGASVSRSQQNSDEEMEDGRLAFKAPQEADSDEEMAEVANEQNTDKVEASFRKNASLKKRKLDEVTKTPSTVNGVKSKKAKTKAASPANGTPIPTSIQPPIRNTPIPPPKLLSSISAEGQAAEKTEGDDQVKKDKKAKKEKKMKKEKKD